MPQTKEEWDAHRAQPDFFRFVTITNLSTASDTSSTRSISWHVCAPEAEDFQELRVLAYYWALYQRTPRSQTVHYVGIIQTRANELEPWLGPDSWRSSLRGARAQYFQDFKDINADVSARYG